MAILLILASLALLRRAQLGIVVKKKALLSKREMDLFLARPLECEAFYVHSKREVDLFSAIPLCKFSSTIYLGKSAGK